MADAKPTETGLFHKEHYKEVFYLIGALALIGAIFNNFIAYWSNVDFSAAQGYFSTASSWASFLWHIWKPLALLLIIGSVFLAIYSSRKVEELKKEEDKIFGSTQEDDFLAPAVVQKDKESERWQRVLQHANSDNPSDWRLAVIEADIMLDDLLKSLGYHGDGVGEMLKSVDPSDMLTLDNAWEAHKVRNRIAHSGSAFELNERETKRVITLFQSVFNEFGII